jgi:hypothetical protein
LQKQQLHMSTVDYSKVGLIIMLLLPCHPQGWAPQEPDMQRVVAIHNSVNERAWQHVLAWEALHACDCSQPRLVRFQGKPNEFSPKARLLNMLVRQLGRGGTAYSD